MALFERLRRFASVSLPFVLALLTGCRPEASPVRIGLAGSFHDPVGAPMRHAAELAVAEINASGGVRGRPIELIARDDHADPDSAVYVANELYDAGVVAVVGHLFSGATLAAAPVYNGGTDPVVALSPSSSSPEVSTLGDYTFRLCPSDLVHGQMLARWAWHRLRLQRGAVLYLNDQYGRGIRQTFVQEFGRLGGTLISVDPYLGDAPDVGPFLDRLSKGSAPEFLLVAGNRGEAEAILRQLRQRGIRLPVLGGDGLEGIEQSGTLADGVYFSSPYFPNLATPANERFVAAYGARYPAAGPPNQPAAATYDAIYLLREVIGRVGTERAAVRRALAGVGSATPAFEGVTGRVAFDAAGDVSSQRVHVGLVKDGAVQPQEDS